MDTWAAVVIFVVVAGVAVVISWRRQGKSEASPYLNYVLAGFVSMSLMNTIRVHQMNTNTMRHQQMMMQHQQMQQQRMQWWQQQSSRAVMEQERMRKLQVDQQAIYQQQQRQALCEERPCDSQCGEKYAEQCIQSRCLVEPCLAVCVATVHAYDCKKR